MRFALGHPGRLHGTRELIVSDTRYLIAQALVIPYFARLNAGPIKHRLLLQTAYPGLMQAAIVDQRGKFHSGAHIVIAREICGEAIGDVE